MRAGVRVLTSEVPTAGSVSRVECVASVRGKGDAKVSLFRHLAPLTVSALLGTMPADSRVNVQATMVCLFTTIRIGVEKPRTTFSRGDVALLPSGGLVCFFLKDSRSDRPLNPLGKVEEGISIFDGVRSGDTVRLAAATPSLQQAP